MQEDAIRWNKRHSDGFMPKQPSDILHTYQPLLESYVQKGSAQALDIACGNGRNAKFLAALGFEVLGVDISQVALDSLQGMEHITTLCVDLDSFDFGAILIDPPRSGVGDEAMLEFIARFRVIVYISCAPQTLCDDLRVLKRTHTIHTLALFEQFPYTHHIESICILTR